jgi:hypothetical protein
MSSDKNCIFLHHLSTGDNFTVFPAICELYTKYKSFHIFVLNRNKLTIKQLFEPFNNIVLHELEENYNSCHATQTHIKELQKSLDNCEIIVAGFYRQYPFKTAKLPFYREFYFMIDLNYDNIRNKYKKINRNLEQERKFYNKVISRYGENYIFTHDHRHVKYRHYDPRANINISSKSNLPIFHVNINIYNPENKYYNLWSEDLISNNIMDYGILLENAKEIYIVDSSFSCLCCYLDLSKVEKKVIKNTSGIDIRDYDQSYKEWIII